MAIFLAISLIYILHFTPRPNNYKHNRIKKRKEYKKTKNGK